MCANQECGENGGGETLGESQVIILVIPGDAYLSKLMGVVKGLASGCERICYVSLNSPYKSVVKSLVDHGVDTKKFFFVDAITRTAEIPQPNPRVEFTSSPGALTELSLTLSKVLMRDKFDYLLFDSLSTLLVYESENVVTKFVHFLIAKVRVIGSKSIFTCLTRDMDSTLIKDISMFSDKLIDLEHWRGI